MAWLLPPVPTDPVFHRPNIVYDFCGFGALDFVSPASQTADWYTWSSWCAEAPSAVSNIGFFLVGTWFDFWPLHVAGLASFVSHCVPLNILLWLDKVAVVVVVAAVAAKAPSLKFIIPYLLCLALLAFTELHLRRRGWRYVHDIWHLGAAVIAAVYLSSVTRRN